IDYYTQRTSNGSTLSRIVHSWVLARSDRARSWALLEEALESDIADVQGGTTPEGIHLGAMAGTVDLVQRGHTGLDIREDHFRINPCLPEELGGLRMRVRYRGCWLAIDMDRQRMRISAPEGWSGTRRIVVGKSSHAFDGSEVLEFPCMRERGGTRPGPRSTGT